MNTATITKKLEEFIQTGDEKLLKLMYAVAKEYTGKEEEYELSNEDVAELDRRRDAWLKGDSKGYTWADTKEIISEKRSFDEL